MFMVKDTRGKYTGVLINQDKAWQQHRRFLERIFRELGVAKSTWESNIHDELNHFLAEITSKNGEAFDIHQLLNMSVANVTNKIILGDRFEYSDESFQRHVKMIDDIMNNWQLSVFFNMYPWTRLLPGDPTNYFTLKKCEHSRQYDVIQPMIDKRKTECEKNGRKNDKDIIGYYLNALEEKDKLVKYSTFEMLQLRCIIDDLFFAGTETTSTTMRWALLYMIKYPHIQEKVRQEIFDNIGKGRLPSLNDRESLPYTEAVLLEIQRYNSIVPLAVPHQTTADVTFKGYHIPKGVLVYPNLWALHRDPTLWKNPNIFDPLRFLDENGHVVKPPHFMPFSIGKRICAGEVLAKSEMFLYFSTMMQRFNFTFPNGRTTPSMEGVLGITLCPEPFKLCATRI
ncbi:unnamed protein product [Owenia fusiformis]|nr:unnamed protein product [Owenia fusiformis]